MKKALLITLAAALLVTSLASCSRRNQYEDQLESQKLAESLDAIPETNGNITGDSAPDYATPVILKTGNTPFYEGKTLEDLNSIFKNTGKISMFPNMLPSGRVYDGNDTQIPYFYNKLTGNFSRWCSDPLCDGEDCIWFGTIDIQYVSDEYIYVMASPGLDEYGIFRCDFQRNHMEKIKDVAYYRLDGQVYRDTVEVVYEKDDVLYIYWRRYVNTESVGSLYTLDLNTNEERIISGDLDIDLVTIINDQIYYSTRQNRYTLYKTDLSFETSELFWENGFIDQYNDQYLILKDRTGGASSVRRYSYNMQTGERYVLNDLYGDVCLSGSFLYYTRDLADEEMENDPLKDYYTYTWQISARPGVVRLYDADTQKAGKIYRVSVDSDRAPEECVFQLTYKGIPVRINQMEMDGEVIYINFNTHETCKNFYNQQYSEEESRMVCQALVDLHNGCVTILELPKEE